MAKAFGIKHMAMPTNGNAGAALAAYATRAGIKTTIFCPEDTPEVNVSEIAMQGANVYRVNGLIGMWKAFDELEALGFIGSKRPRMVAVQAEGCAPIVEAWQSGEEHAPRWEDAHTVAAGIRVPKAIGDFLILRAVRASKGFAIAVPDDEIVQAVEDAATRDGLLLCPEGGATLAAARRALREGLIASDDRVLLFNCATGLKYPMPDRSKSLDRTQKLSLADL
jgi:threonine synthase